MDQARRSKAFVQVDQAEPLWTACADVLREQVSEAVWLTTFSSVSPLGIHDGRLLLAVPSSVVKDRIELRYLAVVEGALADIGRPGLRLDVQVQTADAEHNLFESDDVHNVVPTPADDELLAPGPLRQPHDTTWPERLAPTDTHHGGSTTLPGQPVNSRYTFDAFVTGTSNRFAHAAALGVAETPARSYNPLFIYGDAGLGKTHLLQAIAPLRGRELPRPTWSATSPPSTFLNQFVDAIRRAAAGWPSSSGATARSTCCSSTTSSSSRARSSSRRSSSTPSIASTRPIARSCCRSDRPPDAISTLEDRLRSRFKMGLITEINPPELETRLAILRKKAEREPVAPPARRARVHRHAHHQQHPRARGRPHPGVRLRAASPARRSPCRLAEQVLDDILSDTQPRPITPALILRTHLGDVRLPDRRDPGARAADDRSSPPARSACTCSAS